MKDRTIFKTILAIAFCIILLIGLYILTNSFNKEYTNENEKIKQENIIKEINSSYNKYVKTNKEAKLYTLDNNKHEEIGTISADVELELNEKNDVILNQEKECERLLAEKELIVSNYNEIVNSKRFKFANRVCSMRDKFVKGGRNNV